MLKRVLTELNLINGEWIISKNLIRQLLMFQNIQKLSKLKMFKGLDIIRYSSVPPSISTRLIYRVLKATQMYEKRQVVLLIVFIDRAKLVDYFII